MLPKILSVKVLPNYFLEINYDKNIIKYFSVYPYLNYTVYKPLADINFFNSVIVKYNTLVWGKEEDIDFDPYTLFTESIEENEYYIANSNS